MESSTQRHRFVFLGGLHRSGTSLLYQCLQSHPLISGLQDTGVPEDEGQHLQTVYRRAAEFGGPGVFGFSPEAHQTEASRLASAENRQTLFDQWRPYWEVEKPWLMEKTPQNLLQSRLLQALFPEAYFVIVTRDPVAVAYATRKWSHTSLHSLLEHWLHCHEIFQQDRAHLRNVIVVRYEDLTTNPRATLESVYQFLGIPFHVPTVQVRDGVNAKYHLAWLRDRRKPIAGLYCQHLQAHFGQRMASSGYAFPDADAAGHVASTWLPASVACGISWIYRGSGGVLRVGSRAYKHARRRMQTAWGISRKRHSAVHG